MLIFENKFKTQKVFDCQDMPQNVMDAFFDRQRGRSNDSYVKCYVYDEWKIVGVTSGDWNKKYYIDGGHLDTPTDNEIISTCEKDGLLNIIIGLYKTFIESSFRSLLIK